MKPSIGRIVTFFALYVGGIALPVIAGLLIGFLGPDPYLLHEQEYRPEDWREPRQFADGSSVTVHGFASEGEAKAAMASVTGRIPMRSMEKTMRVTRYRQKGGERRGIVMPVGKTIVHVEASDEAAVDRRLAGLPFVVENERKNPMWVLFTEHLTWALWGIAVWVALLSWFFSWGGPWAARIEPRNAVSPIGEGEMRRRIMALNELDLPFGVTEAPRGRLLATWRIADARWCGILETGGLKKAHRIRIELDPIAHDVRVVEDSRTVSFNAGIGRLAWSFSFWRGISLFAYESGRAVGVLFKEGRWCVDDAYRYRFSASEMKNPLIEATLAGGWTFAPVLTFFRLHR